MTYRSFVLAILVTLLFVTAALAEGPVPNPVPLPTLYPLRGKPAAREQASQRAELGRFGELLAQERMKSLGYVVVIPKIQGNRGIDGIAIRRGPNGRLNAVRIIEVKTTVGLREPSLSRTKWHGQQLSRAWIANKLWHWRKSGPEARSLVAEIYSYLKERGIKWDAIIEKHTINLRTGQYGVRTYGPHALTVRPIARDVLYKIPQTTPPPNIARSIDMTGGNYSRAVSHRAILQFATRTVPVYRTSTGSVGRFGQWAGRAGTVFAVAITGYELYELDSQYRSGAIGRREYAVQGSGAVGGLAGSLAGGYMGAKGGAIIGSFICPGLGTVIVASVGFAVCGIAGYFTGHYLGINAATLAVSSLFSDLDDEQRDQVIRDILMKPYPLDIKN